MNICVGSSRFRYMCNVHCKYPGWTSKWVCRAGRRAGGANALCTYEGYKGNAHNPHCTGREILGTMGVHTTWRGLNTGKCLVAMLALKILLHDIEKRKSFDFEKKNIHQQRSLFGGKRTVVITDNLWDQIPKKILDQNTPVQSHHMQITILLTCFGELIFMNLKYSIMWIVRD